jgi:hypothetical protein
MQGILPPLIQWRHGKLTPFPNSVLEIASRKELLIHRIDELSQHQFVHQIFDIASIRRLVEALPDAKASRSMSDPASTFPFVLISGALQYARYVEEHF